jgi:hypothetical protein
VVGVTLFAAVMMMLTGIYQAIAGLAAIFGGTFYVVTSGYLASVDVTAWGWVLLVIGIVVAAAGFSLMAGRLWARIVGITAASVSAIANFLFIPYYPFWAMVTLVMDIWVIWALARYTRVPDAD